jgi:DNA-binding transcriptional LysR family regulator
VQLLARTPRRVTLTHAGAAFLDQVRTLLSRATEAIDVARAAERGETGRLRIGFMSSAGSLPWRWDSSAHFCWWRAEGRTSMSSWSPWRCCW